LCDAREGFTEMANPGSHSKHARFDEHVVSVVAIHDGVAASVACICSAYNPPAWLPPLVAEQLLQGVPLHEALRQYEVLAYVCTASRDCCWGTCPEAPPPAASQQGPTPTGVCQQVRMFCLINSTLLMDCMWCHWVQHTEQSVLCSRVPPPPPAGGPSCAPPAAGQLLCSCCAPCPDR
jgi:hypothetical protein